MEKWICKVCGYTHYGDEAPERCPRCGAPKSQFYRASKGQGCALSLLSLLIILPATLLALMGCSSLTVDNSVVNDVNLNRYLGRWYEIARFDHRFERGLTHCTALYTLNDDGTILVTNSGMKKGRLKTSQGIAKTTDSTGLLRVSFFRPFYSDYRILLLAPDYTYALIGGSNDNYLWILSRAPQLPDATRDNILREAQRRGYDTNNLLWVDQRGI